MIHFLQSVPLSASLALQVKKLNSMIAEKKTALAPIIKELRPLRQECQVTNTHTIIYLTHLSLR